MTVGRSAYSAESIRGWSQLYLSLGAWPERIREAAQSDHRSRDELEFYLCFFVQCHSLRDWIVRHGVVGQEHVDSALGSYWCMKACRDIANRWKHLIITKPSLDANWYIQRCEIAPEDYEWKFFGDQQQVNLWDLMHQCLGFWEALVAGFHLEVDDQWFVRPS